MICYPSLLDRAHEAAKVAREEYLSAQKAYDTLYREGMSGGDGPSQ